MLMEITDRFETPTSKSYNCVKNFIIMAWLTVSFKPRAKF